MRRNKVVRQKRMMEVYEARRLFFGGKIPVQVYTDLKNELIEPSFDVNLATRLAHEMVEERKRNH